MTDEKDREDLRLEGLRGYRYDKRFKPLSVDGPDALPLGHRIVSTINLSTGEKGRASLTDTGRLDELTSDPSTPLPALTRSEEHTSELQSLMRISYAVYCLQKKTPTHNLNTNSNS